MAGEEEQLVVAQDPPKGQKRRQVMSDEGVTLGGRLIVPFTEKNLSSSRAELEFAASSVNKSLTDKTGVEPEACGVYLARILWRRTRCVESPSRAKSIRESSDVELEARTK